MIRYLEHPLGPRLEPFVECLWSAWTTAPLQQREVQRIVPDGCPELIVHLGDPFARRVAGRWQTQTRAFLAGTLTAPWLLRPGRRVRTLGIRFRPGAVREFLPVDMKAAVNREVPLGRILGAAAEQELLASLVPCRTTDRRFQVLESWLIVLLGRHGGGRRGGRRGGRQGSRSQQAVGRILDCRGGCAIEQLAEDVGCHRRSLERHFAHDLGITPKLFARIVRLNAVLASLSEPERAIGVDLALEMGFFDQSHLLRDARRLAGRRLSASRDRDGSMAKHFTDPIRLRQLLRGALAGGLPSHSSKLAGEGSP